MNENTRYTLNGMGRVCNEILEVSEDYILPVLVKEMRRMMEEIRHEIVKLEWDKDCLVRSNNDLASRLKIEINRSFERMASRVVLSPATSKGVHCSCPNCSHIAMHEAAHRPTKTAFGDSVIATWYYCSKCGWEWQLDHDGDVKNLRDGIPF